MQSHAVARRATIQWHTKWHAVHLDYNDLRWPGDCRNWGPPLAVHGRWRRMACVGDLRGDPVSGQAPSSVSAAHSRGGGQAESVCRLVLSGARACSSLGVGGGSGISTVMGPANAHNPKQHPPGGHGLQTCRRCKTGIGRRGAHELGRDARAEDGGQWRCHRGGGFWLEEGLGLWWRRRRGGRGMWANEGLGPWRQR